MNEKLLFYQDAYTREFRAVTMDIAGNRHLLSGTAFYPGGGGQPPDQGWIEADGEVLDVKDVHYDEAHAVWHTLSRIFAVGQEVLGRLNWPLRYALMRHHTLLHIVNTVVLRE